MNEQNNDTTILNTEIQPVSTSISSQSQVTPILQDIVPATTISPKSNPEATTHTNQLSEPSFLDDDDGDLSMFDDLITDDNTIAHPLKSSATLFTPESVASQLETEKKTEDPLEEKIQESFHEENIVPPGYIDNPIDNPYVPASIPDQHKEARALSAPFLNTMVAQSEALPQQKISIKKPLLLLVATMFLVLALAAGAAFFLKEDTKEQISSKEKTTSADAQRTTDTGVIVVAIKAHAAKNNGLLPKNNPSTMQNFYDDYLTETFIDPTTEQPYVFVTDVPVTGEFQYITSAQCGSKNEIITSTESDQFAIRSLLENGDFYCADG